MERFTREELKKYNGTGRLPIYIAVEGKVYDVTKRFLWREGRHQARHTAGRDLTDALKEAPHGIDVLKRCPVVGLLTD